MSRGCDLGPQQRLGDDALEPLGSAKRRVAPTAPWGAAEVRKSCDDMTTARADSFLSSDLRDAERPVRSGRFSTRSLPLVTLSLPALLSLPSLSRHPSLRPPRARPPGSRAAVAAVSSLSRRNHQQATHQSVSRVKPCNAKSQSKCRRICCSTACPFDEMAHSLLRARFLVSSV